MSRSIIIVRERDETCLIVGFQSWRFQFQYLYDHKISIGPKKSNMVPTCQIICISRFVVDIKSEEIFQVVSFQNQEYKQNYLYDQSNQYGCQNPNGCRNCDWHRKQLRLTVKCYWNLPTH